MYRVQRLSGAIALSFVVLFTASPVLAAQCGGSFDAFISTFGREAAAAGISQRTVSAALASVDHQPSVVSLDRRQGAFKQSFEQFASSRVTSARLQRAQRLLDQHRATFNRIEQQYGVPREIVVAIWGLETDFGANMGRHPALSALATLAHDCRRSEFFQEQLMSALRVIDRGDLSPAEMRGAWAGELGQTQFLPSSYFKFAVDFDGDGRRNLIRSTADALGSTANYLRGYGWQAGGGWSEGSHNFQVLREWNRAQVYQKTIALFATRLSGGSQASRSGGAVVR
jgi:lytic murein transglycosylase